MTRTGSTPMAAETPVPHESLSRLALAQAEELLRKLNRELTRAETGKS